MAEKACHVFGSTTQVGLTQALGPLFSRIANLVDRKAVRAALVAVLVVAVVLFGPLAVLLLGFAAREPAFFFLGVGGLAGLVGASCRVLLGPRFFLLRLWFRIVVAGCLAAGIAAAFLAVLYFPGRVYWATLLPLFGLVGLVVLAGSVASNRPGPNNSFNPMPLRGTG